MPTALKNLKIDRVSLVDRPANQGADVVLTKRDDSEDTDEIEKAKRRRKTGGTGMAMGMQDGKDSDGDNDASKPDDDEDDAVGKADAEPYWKRDFSAEDRTRMAGNGQAESDGSYPIATTSDLHNAIRAIGRSSNPTATKKHIISRAHALGATSMLPEDWKVSKQSQENTTMPTETEIADGEQVTKADLETIRKQYEDQLAVVSKSLEDTTARAIAAETVAKAEAEQRESRDAIAKAEREYPSLPGTTAAETGALVRTVAKGTDAETVAKLEAILKAASVALAKGDLFTEAGAAANQNDGSGAFAKLQVIAKGLRTSDPEMSEHQAIAKAVKLNPDLATEYRQESGFVPAGGYRSYR